jgi:hypothetical protein
MATTKAHWGKPNWVTEGEAERPVLNMAETCIRWVILPLARFGRGLWSNGRVLLWATAPLGNCASFVGLLAGRFLRHRLNLLGGAGVTGLNLWSIVVARRGAIILPFARLPGFFHTTNAT